MIPSPKRQVIASEPSPAVLLAAKAQGLKVMSAWSNPGLKALLQVAGGRTLWWYPFWWSLIAAPRS